MGLEDDEGGRHGRRRVRDRLGPTSPASSRFPCRYLHSELPEAPPERLRPSHRPSAAACGGGGGGGGNCVVSSTREKPCKFFLSGDCRYGDECRCYLHAGSINDGFSLLTPLRGHQKAVTAIVLPSGTHLLFSSSKDGTVRVSDYQTEQEPLLFVGIPDAVKIWDTGAEMSLSEPTGEYMHWRLAMGCSSLQCNYTTWRYCAEKDSFELASSLVGHHRIRAWDLAKLQWTHPFWSYRSYNALALLGSISIILFSGSNNQGLGCYGKLETGSLAVTYTHNEDHGALALAGMQDAQLNPILLWSTNYNIVHLYELPSFAERGKISFEAEVGAVKNGPGGLIFTSDEIGKLKLWKWTAERTSGVSN
uniref:C3H1-type domain-containing protein n=1 Tax=Oryza rufipogon TaxID=4529 RepID=A0A0E0PCX3_ORYRU